MTPFAEGVWVDSAPARIVGMPLTSTMTAVRLGDGSLLLHSPIAMTPERRAAVEALGPVAHLYAPNLFHHLQVGEWSVAFPAACVHGPARLSRKRPDLRLDRPIGAAPPPAFAGVLEEVAIDGFRLDESVVVHLPSGTAVVADLVHDIGRPPERWTKIHAGAMARPFDRLIVGHGAPVRARVKETLAAAYDWLPR